MERIRCGTIVSDSFIEYLEDVYLRDKAENHGNILSIDYLRCAEGERAGQNWWRLTWLPRARVPSHMIYPIGGIDVCLPDRTRHGLKDRFIDYKNGNVLVS